MRTTSVIAIANGIAGTSPEANMRTVERMCADVKRSENIVSDHEASRMAVFAGRSARSDSAAKGGVRNSERGIVLPAEIAYFGANPLTAGRNRRSMFMKSQMPHDLVAMRHAAPSAAAAEPAGGDAGRAGEPDSASAERGESGGDPSYGRRADS